ncbi:MAG: M1 family aminopeptidase, partial [Saprospiraceae bacterium]|nr:M1 family aminopeptidase [Saprospiraceae bacterium]
PRYNASYPLVHDLIHTRLDLSFDWVQRRVHGKAVLTLRPWFYSTDRLTLDAKNFDIHYVGFDGRKDTLPYEYDNAQLNIALGRTFTRKDTFRIVVHYTAKPEERDDFGGSAAITSDKGFFFINADGSDPNKPRQLWTQGETEHSSRWFPTLDKPNQRCTQEMFLTVEDRYKTLSNGVLKSSKKNPNGTRTDHWVMDKPHAPYLFMVAVGEYAVVRDRWRNIPVEYYVEPEYEPYARDIFPHTPEMLELFSQKLGYPYPWPKYAQVVVRDFVSGAMENTTAVVFGDFVQKNRRALIDQHTENERIVAHEMFHHWFGDLVTTESWANLTLNEGFANYAEYLWFEHKYGRDEADFHYFNERQNYFGSAQDGGHPLIHFGYEKAEDMFDAHSYNKGGAVLHMLRYYVGDEAFWAALNDYLTRHAYSSVEVHDLRLAFERVTGQDLNWFFNQWFLSAGHPKLDITYNWDEEASQAIVTITQTQEAKNGVPYVFDLPLKVDIYEAAGKRPTRHNIRVTKRSQTFTFDLPRQPALINVDADKTLLAEKNDQHTPEEWVFMYRNAPLWQDRLEALQGLQALETPLYAALLQDALRDRHWVLRIQALFESDLEDQNVASAVVQMAESDPHPRVRAQAIETLGNLEDPAYKAIFEKGIHPDAPYSVLTASLSALSRIDKAAALKAAQTCRDEKDESVAMTVAALYAEGNADPANAEWFFKTARWMDNASTYSFFDYYTSYLTRLDDSAITQPAVDFFYATATTPSASLLRRFSSTRSIYVLLTHLRESARDAEAEKLERLLADIRKKEKDELLQLYYSMFE